MNSRPQLPWPRLAGAGLLLLLLFAIARVIANPDALLPEPAPQSGSQHIVQAELWSGSGGNLAPPPLQRGAEPRPGTGRPVALPHGWTGTGQDRTAPHAGLAVTWLRMPLAPALREAASPYLYLPRWQATGRIAIYADDRLLFHSDGDPVWSAFNFPLCLPLRQDAGAPLPAAVWLRIDGLAGTPGAVSSLWVGSETAVVPRYRLRRLLQIDGPAALDVATLGLGSFALLVWLRRTSALRRARLEGAAGQGGDSSQHNYLLFAIFAVLWVLRGMRFQMGLEPLPIPPAWFTWITIVAGNALVLTWYLFVSTLVPIAPRWPVPVLWAAALLSALASLPLLSQQGWAGALVPLAYLTTIAVGWPSNALMAWYAWRHHGREGLVAAAVGLLHLPVSLHDGLLQNQLLSPEQLYAWPLSTLARLSMFIYVITRRYAQALGAAEQASLHLAQRLREREAELAASDESLRAAQQQQALDQERQRLMQDIHDGMGSQLMSALKVAESGAPGKGRMAQVLRECIGDLKLTVDSIETVDTDLLLLLATLRYRLDQRLQGSGIRIHWDAVEVPALQWLDSHAALHVLRILQEAVSNVLEHARATELRVSTAMAEGGVLVTLEDDGCGTMEAIEASADMGNGGGKGIGNMRRRAVALGARLRWEGLAAGGMRFSLWLPSNR